MNSRYIKNLRIINFQSHKNTTMNFSNGLNVIVGESDVGKTAIIRALKWVLFNEPKGASFINRDSDECIVEINYSDGISLIRKRNKKFNGYIIINNGEKVEYRGFGNSVPEEVRKITGVTENQLVGKKFLINFQTQFDNMFLLSETPGDKSKIIGSIINIDKVDLAIAKAKNHYTSLNKKINELKSESDELKESIKEFSDIEDRIIVRDSIACKKEVIDLNKKTLDQLQRLNQEFKEISLIKNIKEKDVLKYNILDSAIKTCLELDNKNNLYNFLIDKHNRLKENIKNKEQYRRILDKDIDISKVFVLLKETEIKLNNYIFLKNCMLDLVRINDTKEFINNKYKNYDKIVGIYKIILEKVQVINDLVRILNEFIKNKKQIDLIKNKIQEYDSQKKLLITEYIDNIKKINICPLCGGEITTEHIEIIEKELKNE